MEEKKNVAAGGRAGYGKLAEADRANGGGDGCRVGRRVGCRTEAAAKKPIAKVGAAEEGVAALALPPAAGRQRPNRGGAQKNKRVVASVEIHTKSRGQRARCKKQSYTRDDVYPVATAVLDERLFIYASESVKRGHMFMLCSSGTAVLRVGSLGVLAFPVAATLEFLVSWWWYRSKPGSRTHASNWSGNHQAF